MQADQRARIFKDTALADVIEINAETTALLGQFAADVAPALPAARELVFCIGGRAPQSACAPTHRHARLSQFKADGEWKEAKEKEMKVTSKRLDTLSKQLTEMRERAKSKPPIIEKKFAEVENKARELAGLIRDVHQGLASWCSDFMAKDELAKKKQAKETNTMKATLDKASTKVVEHSKQLVRINHELGRQREDLTCALE